jgi:hypothetical protein
VVEVEGAAAGNLPAGLTVRTSGLRTLLLTQLSLGRVDAGDLVTFLFDLFVERRNLVALGLNFADRMALLTERIHLPADFGE